LREEKERIQRIQDPKLREILNKLENHFYPDDVTISDLLKEMGLNNKEDKNEDY
jgi:hypothetical protein